MRRNPPIPIRLNGANLRGHSFTIGSSVWLRQVGSAPIVLRISPGIAMGSYYVNPIGARGGNSGTGTWKWRTVQEAFSLQERLRGRDSSERLDELARMVAAGDPGAFDAIYQETVDEVFTFVRWQCRNETLAEDLVANVFLKAWRSARSYRQGSGSYRRWLFAIARNEMVDHWRRSKDTLSIDGLELADSSTAEIEQPQVDHATVLDAMAKLTPEQREVVVMRFFREYSHAEIGRALGKREGAVRAQLLRALRQMRKVMSDAST